MAQSMSDNRPPLPGCVRCHGTGLIGVGDDGEACPACDGRRRTGLFGRLLCRLGSHKTHQKPCSFGESWVPQNIFGHFEEWRCYHRCLRCGVEVWPPPRFTTEDRRVLRVYQSDERGAHEVGTKNRPGGPAANPAGEAKD